MDARGFEADGEFVCCIIIASIILSVYPTDRRRRHTPIDQNGLHVNLYDVADNLAD